MSDELWRDNWITPSYIMDQVSEFYDGEYFDPFPINPSFDAFKCVWEGKKLWLNPPYSQLGEIVKLVQYRGKTSLWLTHHNHSSKWFKTLTGMCIAQCQLFDRVKFIDPRTMVASTSTAFGKCQTITYISPYTGNLDMFVNCFDKLGNIMIRR